MTAAYRFHLHVPNCTLMLDIFTRVRKIVMSVCLSVGLSVCMEQLGSHWTDFDEIRYVKLFSRNMSRKFKFYQNVA